MNKIEEGVSLLASGIVILKFAIEVSPCIKEKIEKYFPTTEQITRYLVEYDKESNSLNKKANYRSDYIKLFRTVLTSEPYYLLFNSNKYGELTNYLFEGFKEGQSENFYGLSLLKKGDYLEITTYAKCFKKRLCRKMSIKYLNGRLEKIKGGRAVDENLQMLCQKCNNDKSSK